MLKFIVCCLTLIISTIVYFSFFLTTTKAVTVPLDECRKNESTNWGQISAILPDTNPKISQLFNVSVNLDTNFPNIYQNNYKVKLNGIWFPRGSLLSNGLKLIPGQSVITFTDIQAPAAPGKYDLTLYNVGILGEGTGCKLGTITIENTGSVTFGPVKFVVPTEYQEGSVLNMHIVTQLGTYDFTTTPYRALKAQTLEAYSTKPGVKTVIDVTLGKTQNGEPDIRGTFNPPSSHYELDNGESTGEIVYNWTPKVGQPKLTLSPHIVAINSLVEVNVVLPQPLAKQYKIKLDQTNPTSGILDKGVIDFSTSFTLNCTSTSCQVSGGVDNKFKDLVVTDSAPIQANFSLFTDSNYKPGMTYYVWVESTPASPLAMDSFLVKSDLNDALGVSIDPDTLKESQTKNAPINVILSKGSTQTYIISMPNIAFSGQEFTCNGPGCSMTYRIRGEGLKAGTYGIQVTNKNKPSISEIATLNVTPDETSPGGENGGDGSQYSSWNCGVEGQPACTSAKGVPCGDGVLTAIGCVPTKPDRLIQGLMKVFAGAGGGIALLLMAFGAIQMITSQGSPEGIKAGQERFASAALGLLFVIFSVLLLEIIGVNILGLNQFGIGIDR